MAQFKDEKTGLWYYTGAYPIGNGKRKYYKKRGFVKKRDAKEAEELFRKSLVFGVDNTITLDELVNIYALSDAHRNVKESTLVGDEIYYKNHIKDYLGDYQLNKITVPIINAWLAKLAIKKKKDGTLYSSRTINHAKNILSKYLTYGVSRGYIQHNPARDVSSFKSPEEKDKIIPFWEEDEFKYFIDFVDEQYWKEVFTFLYGTGLREGELFALQWEDINLVKGTCSITKSITNKTKGTSYKITTPKNKNSIRTIELQSTLCDMLRNRYLRESKKDGFNRQYFVFGDIRPLSRSNLARNLDRYIEISGVTRITPHGFRHSHVSYLVNNRIDDSLIAERLGHSVAEMRSTYTHIYKSARSSMKDILDKLCK